MTGEEEDTDIGFPGPEHVIAEREWPMRIAMSLLALLAVVGGLIEIPGVDSGITNFLAPAFPHSRLFAQEPSTGSAWVGLIVTPIIGLIGIAIVYRLYVARRGTSARLAERFAPLHNFLVNKWYFDELIDYAVVRPALLIGRVADSVLERIVISGGVTGGVTGVVRAGSATVRRAQTGFLRYYAAAIVLGLSALSLYFLISST
jgi:NADH-quinone oxidoreductase subunit L